MKSFFKSASGNVGITAAVLSIPLMLAAGAALDYSNLSRKNSQLQDAVDAATLMAAHQMGSSSKKELRELVENYLKSALPADQYADIKKVKIKRIAKNGGISVEAKAKHSTSFLRIAGVNKMDYSPLAEVSLPGGGYEIVLVLDSTYSMSADGKMDALKTAATNFVTQLTEFNSITERIKIGIVPFSQYVNVGLSNRHASWLDAPETKTENVCWEHKPVTSKSGCSNVTRYNDGVPYQAEQCSNVTYGPAETKCGDRTTEWKGCVGSRQYPLNLEDRNYSKRVPGLENVGCASEITPMTGDAGTLTSAIGGLTPQGSTYIPAGLTWGLRAISSRVPYKEGVSASKAKSDDVKKLIILMSDGENQSSAALPDSPFHNKGDIDEANDWTLLACNEIKDSDIDLYTIGFGSAISSDVETLLKKCSTDGSNYYPASDNKNLIEVFDNIAGQIARLYLSK